MSSQREKQLDMNDVSL